jgi:hypothetical protein
MMRRPLLSALHTAGRRSCITLPAANSLAVTVCLPRRTSLGNSVTAKAKRHVECNDNPTEVMPEPHDHCQEPYRIPASRSFRQIIDSVNACSFDEGQGHCDTKRDDWDDAPPAVCKHIYCFACETRRNVARFRCLRLPSSRQSRYSRPGRKRPSHRGLIKMEELHATW